MFLFLQLAILTTLQSHLFNLLLIFTHQCILPLCHQCQNILCQSSNCKVLYLFYEPYVVYIEIKMRANPGSNTVVTSVKIDRYL